MNLRAQRIAQTLRERPDLLLRVAEEWVIPGTEDEDMHGVAEEICVATFGARVECACGTLVLPGFLCWVCEEWTAPEEKS